MDLSNRIAAVEREIEQLCLEQGALRSQLRVVTAKLSAAQTDLVRLRLHAKRSRSPEAGV